MIDKFQADRLIVLFVSLLIFKSEPTAAPVIERTTFLFPLMILTPVVAADGTLEEVFATKEGSHKGYAVSIYDDRYVLDTRGNRVDHIHRELPQQIQYVSSFETEVIALITESFLETLKIFERELKNGNRGRLVYLDPYMVSFFRYFSNLYCMSKGRTLCLDSVMYVPDSLYTEASDSDISDKRVLYWTRNPENTVRLRIASRELIYSIGQWHKRELSNSKRDQLNDLSSGFIADYKVFVRVYLNCLGSAQ